MPQSRAGKIYNVLADQIAQQLVTELTQVSAARCLLVSRIGAPITESALIEAKVAMEIADAPKLSRLLAAGSIPLF